MSSARSSSDRWPFMSDLARSTVDWMAESRARPDRYDEVLAFSLATYVRDGETVVPITPRGHDVSDVLGGESA